MSEAAVKALPLFQADVGNDEGIGEWFEVTQDQVNPVSYTHLTLPTNREV